MNRLWKILIGFAFLLLIVEIVLFAPQTLDIRTPTLDSFSELQEEGGVIQQKLSGLHLIESKNESKGYVSHRDCWKSTLFSFGPLGTSSSNFT